MAFQRAAMIALLGHPLLTREHVSPEWQAEYDALHQTSERRNEWQITAEQEITDDKRKNVLYRGNSFNYYLGVSKALEASLADGGGGLILRTIVVNSEANLIKHLARAKSNQLLLRAGIIAGVNVYEVNGAIAGFEWALGRRESLDFRPKKQPQVA